MIWNRARLVILQQFPIAMLRAIIFCGPVPELLNASERDQRGHDEMDARHAGVLFHVDPFVEGVGAAAIAAGVDGDGGDVKADGNVGVRAADAVRRFHPELLDDGAGDLHDLGIRGSRAGRTFADEFGFHRNSALGCRAR